MTDYPEETERLYDAVRRMYDINHNQVSIGAAFLADGAMGIIGFPKDLHAVGWVGCNFHLRQVARSFCRRNFVHHTKDNPQADLFDGLQDRYPRKPLKDSESGEEREPEYVLRDHLTMDDRWYNFDMLMRSAHARLKHARALEEETIKLFGARE